jgi:hypothetical protein
VYKFEDEPLADKLREVFGTDTVRAGTAKVRAPSDADFNHHIGNRSEHPRELIDKVVIK